MPSLSYQRSYCLEFPIGENEETLLSPPNYVILMQLKSYGLVTSTDPSEHFVRRIKLRFTRRSVYNLVMMKLAAQMIVRNQREHVILPMRGLKLIADSCRNSFYRA